MSFQSRAIRLVRGIRRRADIALQGPGRVEVVVLGHQKSGTTAVGALLAMAIGADFSNDPLYRIDSGRAEVVRALLDGSEDLNTVVRSRPALFCSQVLKDPDLSFLASDCARVFPKASVLHVVRDPRDTIRSIADRLKLTAEDLGSNAVPTTEINTHWRRILEGRLPAVDGATIAERLAFRWKLALNRASACPAPVTVLRYEDFRSEKESTIYQLAEGLGLRVTTAIGDRVDVSFQPRGRPSARLEERLGEANLRTIESVCREEIVALGYGGGH